jgi:hypothetical protein
MSETMRMVESSVNPSDEAAAPEEQNPALPAGSSSGNGSSEGDAKYRAWLPPEGSKN